MKLIDIANSIDKSSSNEAHVDLEDLCHELDVDAAMYVEQDRIKSYWVGNWYCTETYVGYRMYFFDDEPVAFSIQSARKNEENFRWFSKDVAIKVKNYLLTLIPTTDLYVETCDINEDIGEGFSINFNSQILHPEKATFNNEKVEIIERIKNSNYGTDSELKIRLSNGEEKIVDIEELEFGFHVN